MGLWMLNKNGIALNGGGQIGISVLKYRSRHLSYWLFVGKLFKREWYKILWEDVG
jgi:hypothetical protein